MAEKAYIVEAVRTAGGKRDGRLSLWHPADLGAKVLDELVTSSSKTFAPKSAGCHKLSLPSLFPPAVLTASTIYAFSAIKNPY